MSWGAFWAQQQEGILIFLCVLLTISVSNLFAMKRLGAHRRRGSPPAASARPAVSALIPARNEQDTIARCVHSLLTQDLPPVEILVLDDHSEDATARVVTALARRDAHASGRVRLLPGRPLPDGWIGKPWACHQLAAAATGDLFLFVDADTELDPHTLRQAVDALLAQRTGPRGLPAGLVSLVPRQRAGSWLARLLLPIIPWSIHSFLPLAIANYLPLPSLSAAMGAFLLFTRDAYDAAGGHAAVRAHAAEDIALARRVKATGHATCLMDGTARVQTAGYDGPQQVWEGLSKNLFAAFDYRIFPFLFVWLWLGLVFLQPLTLLLLATLGLLPVPLSVPLALAAVAAALFLWTIICHRFHFPLYLPPLYPIIILLAVAVALRSLALTLTGSATWKGRTLTRE